MSTPPPPPGQNPPPFQPGQQPSYPQPGQQPPGYQQPGYQQGGYQQSPPGYQQFGNAPSGPQKTNGMSIASLVLSLVNIIPCFWFLPLPALLGVIFGFVGKNKINKDASQKGKGMAIAGIIVGLVFVVLGAIFWIYVSTSDNCYRDGSTFRCI